MVNKIFQRLTIIGITHGSGSPDGIVDRILSRINSKIDVLIYGHTHTGKGEFINGVFCCNPGSLGDDGSYGLLKINGSEFDFELNRV